MRPLPMPPFTTEEVFRKSISKVRDPLLKSRLEACVPEIVQDSDDFNVKATNAQLHLIQRKEKVNNDITQEEMKKVYDDRMVKKSGPGRNYYQDLRYPVGEDKCPFCGQLPASTLDHYLAKSDYPSLAVTPSNLVPACKDCNFIKNSIYPTRSEEEPLHPYFDNITDNQWLFAIVLKTTPVTVKYYINPPGNSAKLLAERVVYHFELYNLGRLYSSEANGELSDLSFQMKQLLESSGPKAVQAHLHEIAESCFMNRKNSWKTALYQALSEDDWYCSYGASL